MVNQGVMATTSSIKKDIELREKHLIQSLAIYFSKRVDFLDTVMLSILRDSREKLWRNIEVQRFFSTIDQMNHGKRSHIDYRRIQ